MYLSTAANSPTFWINKQKFNIQSLPKFYPGAHRVEPISPRWKHWCHVK